MDRRNVTFRWLVIVVFAITSVSLISCAGTSGRVKAVQQIGEVPDSASKQAALDHYLSGTLEEQNDNMVSAAMHYQMALLFDPNSVEIPLALSKVYLRLSEPKAALQVLENAIGRNPDNENLISSAAELSLRLGNLDKSDGLYKRLAGMKSLDRGEMIRQIVILEKQNKREDALKLAKSYLKQHGPDAAIYERIGLIQIAVRNFDAADTAFRKLIEFDPSNHRIQFLLGGFSVAREDFQDAKGFFQKALELEPDELRYWQNYIMVLTRLEREDTLLVVLNDAIRLFPSSPLLFDARADYYQRNGEYELAMNDCYQSLGLDSTRLTPLISLGFIGHRLERWDESDSAYAKAMRIAPDNPVVMNNYAYMLSVQGVRLEQALELVQAALKAVPDSPSYLDTRGWVYYRMGRFEEALQDVELALKTDSENSELYEHLASILEALGKPAEAQEASRKADSLKDAKGRNVD